MAFPGIVPVILLLVSLAALAAVDAKKPVCDASSKHSCLPQCQPPLCPATKAKCLRASVESLFKSVVTPAQGPNLPDFLVRVKQLGALFEPSIVARITPLGVYQTIPIVSDYLATFVHPLGLGSIRNIAGFDVVDFASSGNVAAFSVNLHLLNTMTQNDMVNLTVTGFLKFSNNMKIAHMDIEFLRVPEYQLTINHVPLSALSDPALDVPPARVPDAQLTRMIGAVVYVNENFCVPKNVSGYAGDTPAARQADAVGFLSRLPRVDPFGITGNNTFCRFLHSAYASVDPLVHCPHIGRSGGMFCVPQVYTDYFSVFKAGTFLAA